jgi:acetolactate synthase-1/2/3 large subunit
MKVCDYIIEFLIKNNIDTIFTFSGGFIGPILNSFSKYDIKYYCLCHEQALAMAADAYYRIARKPCCLLVTNGPGASNTLTGVIGAFQDSIPIFILSGNVPIFQSLDSQELPLRQLGVQELNIIPIVKTFTNYAKSIKKKEDLVETLEIAYEKCLSGRMGPVWVEVPLDIQNDTLENIEETKIINLNNIPLNLSSTYNNQVVSKEIISMKTEVIYESIINKINSSKRPLFVIGNGIWLSKTEKIFKEILEKTQIPVVVSWLAKDIIKNNHPLYFGDIGILGERFANFAIQKCDLLICLGCRLTITQIGYDTEGFSRESYKIMVDIDNSELEKKIIHIDLKINEDLSIFLNKFNSSLSNKHIEYSLFNKWIDKLNYWKNKFPSYDKDIDLDGDVNSYYFSKHFSSLLKPNTIIVTDTGSSCFSIFQSIVLNQDNVRLFTASGQCSMGYGLPGAIGAYIADRTKEIILIVGDGGFQMNLQELQSVIYYNIPIKIFIFNNSGYLAIKLMQKNLFKENYVGSSLKSGVSSPDFNKVAESYGLKTFNINKNNEIEIIKEVMDYKGACLCHIKMIPEQLIIPRVQSMGNNKSLEFMFPYIDEEDLKKYLSFIT